MIEDFRRWRAGKFNASAIKVFQPHAPTDLGFLYVFYHKHKVHLPMIPSLPAKTTITCITIWIYKNSNNTWKSDKSWSQISKHLKKIFPEAMTLSKETLSLTIK